MRRPVVVSGTSEILFVYGPPGTGGSNVSLATLLQYIGDDVHRTVIGFGPGRFPDLLTERGLADELFLIGGGGKLGRSLATFRVAWLAFRRRKRLLAIHGNGITGVFLSALAALVSRVPVVAWVHDPMISANQRRIGPIVRRLVRRVKWAAVSEVAAGVAVASRLVERSAIVLIPNPVDPVDVVPDEYLDADPVTVGYMASATHRKGFDVLAEAATQLEGEPLRWKLFTTRRDTADDSWAALDVLPAGYVDVPGYSDPKVIFAQCDVIFVPSRNESFCRVAAEAMLNGIPVVAADTPALRALLGNDEAGLLYPVDDAEAAAAAVRRLAVDPQLRRRLGDEGRARSESFTPQPIVAQFRPLYGLPPQVA